MPTNKSLFCMNCWLVLGSRLSMERRFRDERQKIIILGINKKLFRVQKQIIET